MIRTLRAFDPHSIKLVIFDLDGTLIDSRLDLVHSVNAALRHIGRPELPEDVIASYVGDGAPILIQRALGGEAVDEALVRKGLEFFLPTIASINSITRPCTRELPERWRRFRSLQIRRRQIRRTTARRGRWRCSPTSRSVPSRAIVEALGLGRFFSQIYGGNSFASKSLIPRARVNCSQNMACSRNTLSWSVTPMSTSAPDATRAWSRSA